MKKYKLILKKIEVNLKNKMEEILLEFRNE